MINKVMIKQHLNLVERNSTHEFTVKKGLSSKRWSLNLFKSANLPY